MAKQQQLGITVKKEDDIAEWYSQVILKAQLADYSPIRGCMVIRPNGYAIWQNIQDAFNELIKKRGVKNAYFPLFIPESFFSKEAEHADGFAPEVAWIASKGEEEVGERLAVRPTSETIMYDSYSKWIRSWRDLPLRINQWCNVVRWEVKDVKLFLRSREFLWQEGHCVYATEEECIKETKEYLKDYQTICQDYLAVPVIPGYKTDHEKFAGAVFTTTIESMMPDGKALQCGTSHHLGQGFAKAFDIKYINSDETEKHPFQNSWGISTRLIGATIMLHSDDKGLVLPPRVAETKAIVIPIWFKEGKDEIIAYAKKIYDQLDVEAEIDDREEYKAGFKFADAELRGIPVRIEAGPKDMQNNSAVLVRRDTGDKKPVKLEDINSELSQMLEDIQKSLFEKAKKMQDDSIVEVDNYADFLKAIEKRKMVLVDFCCDPECEDEIKTETTGATTRVIPFEDNQPNGTTCIKCDRPAKHRVYFAKNY